MGALKDEVWPEYPDALINIKTIEGIDYIRNDKKGLRIGALARLADIVESPVVKDDYRLLADAAHSVATPLVRNMATLAEIWPRTYAAGTTGTLAKSADPSSVYAKAGSCAARSPATTGTIRYSALLASPNTLMQAIALPVPMSHPIPEAFEGLPRGKSVRHSDSAPGSGRSIVTTKRSLPAELFCRATAMSSTVLQAEELIKEIQIPKPSARGREEYEKFTLREPVHFTIVSVASLLTLDNGVCKDARIVLALWLPSL